MPDFIKCITGLVILLSLYSCATYKSKYHHSVEDWEKQTPPEDNLQVKHSVFLVGDAGYSPNLPAPTLRALKEALDTTSENGTVVFLGDNIYPKGMPHRDHPDRAEAERNILAQLEAVKDYPGKTFFIPGNHDWYAEEGLEGMERQEDFIQDYLDQGDSFVPDNGCGDIEDEELTDDIVLILMDSEWFLLDWDKHPEINEKCEFKTREDFLVALADELKKARRKHVILALHHPIHSYGPHGGFFGIKDHLFPLTVANDKFLLPLPILGTILVNMRNGIGIPEDLRDLRYRNFIKQIQSVTKPYDNVIFASGHEHNLQYIEEDNKHFIVSGSGSKKNRVALAGGARYTAGKYGFARLDYYQDGSVWLYMFEVDDEGTAKLAFRKKITGQLPEVVDPEEIDFNEGVLEQETVRSSVLSNQEDRSNLYEYIWGEHYRNIYFDSVEARVINLKTEKGGLTPVKRGGGFQTNSLRLVDSLGRQWVFRAIKKDAERLLPIPLQGTFATEIVRDQFTSAHPYAAFVLSPMATAIDIYHTNPELVYVPKQKALGDFNVGFGDALYLFEERPDEKFWNNRNSFGHPKAILSTSDALEKKYDDHDHVIDHAFTVRSRLFDMVIGDWDRHDDQWRWSVLDRPEGGVLLRPIPRDRDQVFSKYDGLLPSLANKTFPRLRQMQVYSEEYDRVEFMNHNARWFDRTFLSEASQDDFVREARHIQRNLTDEVIEEAVALWPEPVYEEVGEEIIRKLKGRRDNLLNAALEYYRFLAENVDVTGTYEDDYFEVERLKGGDTRVAVYKRSKKGKKKEKFYERTFYYNETDEIRLYGLDGDDEFVVTGDVKKGILVRLIGGTDDDLFIDESKVRGWSNKTRVFDYIYENKLYGSSETGDRRSRSRFLNLYNRKAFHYDYGLLFPLLGANPDDGLFLGLTWTQFIHGWKKEPYSQKHKLTVQYAFETSASDFKYVGDFMFTGSRWSTEITALYQGPKYIINYFGQGNETENPFEDDDLDFNRVRQNELRFQPLLKRHFSPEAYFSIGPFIEGIEVERSEGRFIAEANVPNAVFEPQWFAGAKTRLQYRNVDNEMNPHSGLHFFTELDYRTNLDINDRDFWQLDADFRVYMNLTNDERVVLATRLGGAITGGNPFFYHQATLGDLQNLRGYRRQRFTGDHSFYHNTDLRIEIGSISSYYIPLTLGIYGGFDYGRVWLEDADSDEWHQGYGGGLWLSPFDLGILSAGYFKSKDDERITVRLGFFF